MKKFFSLLLFMAFLTPWAAQATDVEIGDGGEANNNYIPGYNYYDYSYSQQIYTATEIGMAGTINSVAFKNTGAEKTRTYSVYMAHTDKETFADGTDWVAMTAADLVFEGELTFAVGDWTVISLDAPFSYDGSSNLIISVADNTGSYSNTPHMACLVFSAESQAIRAYRDNTAYEISDPAVTGTVLAVKNQIILDITPGSGPVCEKPSTFEISNLSTTGADFAWTSAVGNYVFEYKKAADDDWTVVSGLTSESYSLSGLDPDVAYSARVKAVCGTDFESSYKTANFTTLEVCPDGKVCVGAGRATDAYLPCYAYYKQNLTQQIYTAAELGAAGAILSIDFHASIAAIRNLDIYMVSTEKSSFADGTDWIAVTANDLVFSGEVSFAAADWTNIELDNPFIYNGTSNVALIIDDNTGGYEMTYPVFYAFDATDQALRVYSDETDYDPTNPGSYSGTVSGKKNRVRFEIGEPPACAKPTGLTVNYAGGTTATVSWTSDASAFNIDVNGVVTAITENPYTLTGLELATAYAVKVQANCGGATSGWTNAANFSTDLCLAENMCAISYTLTDDYGDGWDAGAAIQVIDAATSEVIETLTLASGSSISGSISLCNGRQIDFVYVSSGSYQQEHGYIIKDINDEIIAEHEGCAYGGSCSAPAAGLIASYTVNCTVNTCRRPSDLAVSEIGPRSVKLNWTENGEATAWKVAYKVATEDDFSEVDANAKPFVLANLDPETPYIVKVRPVCDDADDKWSDQVIFYTDVACPAPSDIVVTPAPTSAEISWTGFGEDYDLKYAEFTPSASAAWLQYDNGNQASNVGSSSGGDWVWGVMYPASMVNGSLLTKIAFGEVDNAYYTDPAITAYVYNGGDDAPETLVGSAIIELDGTNGMREAEINPIEIDPEKNLWIILSVNATYCLTMSDEDGGANSRWFFDGEDWLDFGTVFPTGAAYSFMVRGYVDDIDLGALAWTTETGVTSPATINGLEAEKNYIVGIKSNCGSDGNSGWAYSLFETPSNCAAPNTLVVSGITGNSANLSWTGYQESFNVRYRSQEVATATFFDDFEDGLGQWTIVRDGDGTANTDWKQFDGAFSSPIPAHSGNYMAMSRSWDNVSYNVDNWLITPQVVLDGTLKFWVRDDGQYHEHYAIYVSTTGNDIADFGATAFYEPGDASASWTEISVDLSSFGGALGYIAIRNNDYDQDFILIDDFGIYGEPTPAGAWENLVVNDKSVAISGLDAATKYDVQVQGINASCAGGLTEWSDLAEIHTADVVNISTAGYATYFCSERAYIMPAGVTGHAFAEGVLSDAQYSNPEVVPAGTPLVLHGAAGEYVLVPSNEAGAALAVANELRGVDVTKVVGSETDGYIYYVLSLNAAGEDESVGFYFYNADGKGGFEVPAHKAYLRMTPSPAPARFYLFNGENNATWLNNLEGVEGTLKVYYNGNFYILRDGVLYNATGSKVRSLE